MSEVKSIPQEKSFESLERILPKLKALWLGYSTRKLYLHLIRQSKPNHKYFARSEVFETLSGKGDYIKKYRTYTYKQGGVYVGEWLGGFRHGYGAMVWPDKAKYEGNWAHGRPSGYGKFVHVDQDVYSGTWIVYWIFPKDLFTSAGNFERLKNSASDGFLWLYAKHEIFKSEPPERRRSSLVLKNSILIIENKVKQIKLKSETIFHRLAELKSALKISFTVDKSKAFKEVSYEGDGQYLGNWKDNKRDGYGKMIWPSGDRYEGLWALDKQCGMGKQTWNSGNFYLGEFENDKKEGLGEYHWKDGSFYIGEWKRNKMNGIGKNKWNDGKEYIGEWENGARQGVGVMIYKGGSRYEGAFSNDRQHGLGVFYESDGRVLKGHWENGKFVDPVFK